MPTLTLPRPHPAQQRVMDEAKRFNVVCCGRRWGKNRIGHGSGDSSGARRQAVGLVRAQLQARGPGVARAPEPSASCATRDSNQQERRLELRGGGTVEMSSLPARNSQHSIKRWCTLTQR
jgi:hypothetical protein